MKKEIETKANKILEDRDKIEKERIKYQQYKNKCISAGMCYECGEPLIEVKKKKHIFADSKTWTKCSKDEAHYKDWVWTYPESTYSYVMQ